MGVMAVVGLNLYYFITENEYIYDEIHIKNDLTNLTLNSSWFGLLLTAED